MYSICYVLADNEGLEYYNQMIISAYSLRYRGFKGEIIVIVDPFTNTYIKNSGKTDAIELCLKLKEVAVPSNLSVKEVSRFLKTGCRDYISGDMLYLDTDTLAACELPENVSTAEIAFALDEHWPSIGGSRESLLSDISVEKKKRRVESCGYKYDPALKYFNAGCIWAKDTEFTHSFFREWRDEWNKCRQKGFVLDQMSLYYLTTKYRQFVCELDGVWNVSVNVPQGMRYLDNAIIIHYWNTGESVFRLSDPEIRKKGYNDDEVRSIITNPSSAFYPCEFIKKTEMESPMEKVFRTTSAYHELFDIYKNRYRFFKCINFLLSLRSKNRLFASRNKQNATKTQSGSMAG